MILEYWIMGNDILPAPLYSSRGELKLLLKHDVGVHSGWLPQLRGLVTIGDKKYRVKGINIVYGDLELPKPAETFGDCIEPERIKYLVERVTKTEWTSQSEV